MAQDPCNRTNIQERAVSSDQSFGNCHNFAPRWHTKHGLLTRVRVRFGNRLQEHEWDPAQMPRDLVRILLTPGGEEYAAFDIKLVAI